MSTRPRSTGRLANSPPSRSRGRGRSHSLPSPGGPAGRIAFSEYFTFTSSVRSDTDVAATILLVTAGDNPERMGSEAAFAALCGVSPVEASSGRITRHRLNQGGDRQANNALWRIALVRMTCDPSTRAYVERRTAEGKSKREIIRCLKRHIAREIYRLITTPNAVIDGTEVRTARNTAGISLESAAQALDSWPIRLSRLERGLIYDDNLAHRYQDWLQTA